MAKDEKPIENASDAIEHAERVGEDPILGTAAFDELTMDDRRSAGFCLECRRLVERQADGTCPKGHHARSVVGDVTITDDRELPQLARFNWGAFFMPLIWGPFHRIWAGVFVFVMWLFADTCVQNALKHGGWLWLASGVVVVLTLLFQAWFAMTSSIPAYLKQTHPISIEQYNKRERIWAVAGAIFFVGFLAMATFYDLAKFKII